MERPPEVTSVTVTDAMTFNPGQHPISIKRVTYYVGANGPFVKQYLAANYSDANVIADMQKEVDTLKAIGAVK